MGWLRFTLVVPLADRRVEDIVPATPAPACLLRTSDNELYAFRAMDRTGIAQPNHPATRPPLPRQGQDIIAKEVTKISLHFRYSMLNDKEALAYSILSF